MQGQRGSHRRRRDCELRAERLRAPAHALEPTTLAMTGRETTTVVGDGDEEMLFGKTRVHRNDARVRVLRDIGEGLLQDAQHMQYVLRRERWQFGQIAHLPV